MGHELYLLCLRILHPLHNTSHLFPFSGKFFDGLTHCIIFADAVIHTSRRLLTPHCFLLRLLATEQKVVVGVAQPAELELLGTSTELVCGLFSELLLFFAACVPACSTLLHVMISRQPRTESIMSFFSLHWFFKCLTLPRHWLTVFFRPCLSYSALQISSQALRLSLLSTFSILSAQSYNRTFSSSKPHLPLWLDSFVPLEAAEGTGDGWIGCPCSKALSKEGCESWENICELRGENKPSPYWE